MSSPRSRVLIILLGISVLINLVLVGGVIGHLYKTQHSRPFPMHGSWMLRNLDEDRRQALRPLARSHAQKNRPLRMKMHKTQQRLEAALLSEPIDQAALADATAELQNLSMQMQQQMHEHMLRIMSELEPEERAQALRFLRHHRRGKRPGSHRP